MCRDTRLSNGGGGGGGGNDGHGGDNGGYGGSGRGDLYSKRKKRQKVPKRGPGVAELEKLLREQEKINDTESNEGFSLVSYSSNSHQPPSSNISPPTSSPCESPPFGPNPKGCGGSKSAGLVLPDHALAPKMWMPCEANDDVGRSASGITFPTCLTNGSKRDTNQLFPSPTNWKGRGQNQPQRSFVFCDLSSELKVSSSSRAPSSGLSNGLGPPSSQTAQYHCPGSSVWPEEDKMPGTKCSHLFSKEIPPLPPLYCQVQAFPSFAGGSQVQNSFNLVPTETTPRMTKYVGFSEPNFGYRHTDYRAPDDKVLLLGSATTPPWNMSTSRREESKLNHLSFQDYLEETKHRPGCGRSDHKRPFFSLLLPVDQIRASEKCCSLSNERVETNADGIDLDLRL